MPTLFGRNFLAIVGAVVDMRQSRISFAAIDENVFYKAIPPKVYIQLLTFAAASQKGSSDMSDVKKVSLVPMLNDTTLVLVDISWIGILLRNQTSLGKRGRERGRREKSIKGGPQLTLVPQIFSNGMIEYKVRTRGFPQGVDRQPFHHDHRSTLSCFDQHSTFSQVLLMFILVFISVSSIYFSNLKMYNTVDSIVKVFGSLLLKLCYVLSVTVVFYLVKIESIGHDELTA